MRYTGRCITHLYKPLSSTSTYMDLGFEKKLLYILASHLQAIFVRSSFTESSMQLRLGFRFGSIRSTKSDLNLSTINDKVIFSRTLLTTSVIITCLCKIQIKNMLKQRRLSCYCLFHLLFDRSPSLSGIQP